MAGITKTTDLTNSIKVRYEKAYYLIGGNNPGVWGQFVDWQPPVPEDGGGGSSYDYPVYGESDLVEDALTEDADPAPDTIADSNTTLTPNEYGKTWAITKKARYQSRTNLPEILGKITAKNRINSIDRILRRGAVGHGSTRPTLTMHIDGSATMVSLTANSGTDVITRDFCEYLSMLASTMDIEPFNGGGFKAIVPPALMYDLRQMSEYESIASYQNAEAIFGAVERPVTIAGIQFIPSNAGRVFLGAGALAENAASTLSAAAAKGATSITLTDATDIAVGDWITIGTIETETTSPGANLEQVQVTSIASTPTLSIRGKGVTGFGLRFDHAAGEAVTEAYNVAAIPIIGKNSLIGVYGSDSGKYGIPKAKIGGLDILDRFSYYGWYWYGGVAAVQRNIMLGKVALSKWQYGYN